MRWRGRIKHECVSGYILFAFADRVVMGFTQGAVGWGGHTLAAHMIMLTTSIASRVWIHSTVINSITSMTLVCCRVTKGTHTRLGRSIFIPLRFVIAMKGRHRRETIIVTGHNTEVTDSLVVITVLLLYACDRDRRYMHTHTRQDSFSWHVKGYIGYMTSDEWLASIFSFHT